jgi:flagellar assembly protein FliH
LPQFEESISIASARLSIQTRAEAEQELAEKFVELAVLRARVLEQSQSDIIALAQILAERVIAAELTTRPECILNLAKQTLKEARGAHCVVLHAHPTAVEMLSREIEDLASNCAAQIQVQPDPDLAPGDLQLKTDVGVIDARITTQIANLAMTIRETFRV